MGCASSTEVVIDSKTGQTKTKKKLGGAYPGQRRPKHAPYVPPASDFGKDGTATAHFIAHGGGNALVLVQSDGTHAPQAGKPQAEFVQVTLPDGVVAGQTIHVQAPDGRLNAIVIPPGFGPGSTFTVEFAPDYSASVEAAPVAAPASNAPYNPYAPGATTSQSVNTAMATATAAPPSPQQPYTVPPNQGRPDDGFASGFGGASPVATQVYPTANAYPANNRY